MESKTERRGPRRRAAPARLGRDLHRWQGLQADIGLAERELSLLLAETAGQLPTTLPGVAVNRARRSAR